MGSTAAIEFHKKIRILLRVLRRNVIYFKLEKKMAKKEKRKRSIIKWANKPSTVPRGMTFYKRSEKKTMYDIIFPS